MKIKIIANTIFALVGALLVIFNIISLIGKGVWIAFLVGVGVTCWALISVNCIRFLVTCKVKEEGETDD